MVAFPEDPTFCFINFLYGFLKMLTSLIAVPVLLFSSFSCYAFSLL